MTRSQVRSRVLRRRGLSGGEDKEAEERRDARGRKGRSRGEGSTRSKGRGRKGNSRGEAKAEPARIRRGGGWPCSKTDLIPESEGEDALNRWINGVVVPKRPTRDNPVPLRLVTELEPVSDSGEAIRASKKATFWSALCKQEPHLEQLAAFAGGCMITDEERRRSSCVVAKVSVVARSLAKFRKSRDTPAATEVMTLVIPFAASSSRSMTSRTLLFAPDTGSVGRENLDAVRSMLATLAAFGTRIRKIGTDAKVSAKRLEKVSAASRTVMDVVETAGTAVVLSVQAAARGCAAAPSKSVFLDPVLLECPVDRSSAAAFAVEQVDAADAGVSFSLRQMCSFIALSSLLRDISK